MTILEHNKSSAPAPSSASAAKRPGRSLSQAQEFTIIATLKPGGAERLRKLFNEGFTGDRQHITDRMGTVHDLRFVIFDNDTRMLFASTFDGDWDAYSRSADQGLHRQVAGHGVGSAPNDCLRKDPASPPNAKTQ